MLVYGQESVETVPVLRDEKEEEKKQEGKKKEEEFRLDSNDFGFIKFCAGISNISGYKRNAWYNLSCLLQGYFHLSTNEKLFVSWQFFQTYGVISYGSGWKKDVNQCLEFNRSAVDGAR